MNKSPKTLYLGSALLAGAGILCMLLGTASIVAGVLMGGGGMRLGGGGGGRAGFRGDQPVGLFFMTRFWSGTGTLEKTVWYFDDDGSIYRDLETGFSDEELARHRGAHGRFEVHGDKMTVTWSDGKTTEGDFDRNDDTFMWDMGIFTPVKPFDDARVLVGKWEGGESLSGGGNYVAVSKGLELREDGTFTWSSVSFLSGRTADTEIAAGSEGGTSGRWEASGYSMTLTDERGTVLRRVAFPYDDEKTPVNPDWFYFGGTLYRRQ